MPNHIINVLKFKNLNQSQVWDIVNRITNINPDNPLGPGTAIDFDKIIPEPREEKDCPEDCKVTPDSHVQEDPDRPWFDWYTWHNEYWDTKWNAYEGYVIIKKSSVQFIFNTAWSAPAAIYHKLAKIFPDYEMTVKWADEDYGSNCGEAVHYAGDDGWIINHKDETPDAVAWARKLWRNY